jgi:hypothetical protein
MKSVLVLSTALLGVVVTAGCTAVDDKGSGEPKAPREYRTGSNIPVKDPTLPATDADREKAIDQVRTLQRTGNPGKPGS